MEYGRGRRPSRYSEAYSDDEDLRRGKRRGRREKEGSLADQADTRSPTQTTRETGEGEGEERGREGGGGVKVEVTTTQGQEGGGGGGGDIGGQQILTILTKKTGVDRKVKVVWTPTAPALGARTRGVTVTVREGRIKSQQVDIKKLLSALSELQKKSGIKNLPTEKQKVLQKDRSCRTRGRRGEEM